MVLGSQIGSRAAATVLMALCTALAVRWLWMLWTPQCNESCARATALGMYGVLAVAVMSTFVLILLVGSGRWTVRRGLITYLIVASVLGVSALALTT